MIQNEININKCIHMFVYCMIVHYLTMKYCIISKCLYNIFKLHTVLTNKRYDSGKKVKIKQKIKTNFQDFRSDKLLYHHAMV